MPNKISIIPDPTADLRLRACTLASRASALAADVDALYADMQTAESEPVRRAGFRCPTSAGWARDAARHLRDMAADLERIQAASVPGTCSVPWGACPDHGNTLVSTGGKTWCRTAGCVRAWSHDRLTLPCTEPARWTLTDQTGGTAAMCDGHARDAAKCIDGAQVAPLAPSDVKGLA